MGQSQTVRSRWDVQACGPGFVASRPPAQSCLALDEEQNTSHMVQSLVGRGSARMLFLFDPISGQSFGPSVGQGLLSGINPTSC